MQIGQFILTSRSLLLVLVSIPTFLIFGLLIWANTGDANPNSKVGVNNNLGDVGCKYAALRQALAEKGDHENNLKLLILVQRPLLTLPAVKGILGSRAGQILRYRQRRYHRAGGRLARLQR